MHAIDSPAETPASATAAAVPAGVVKASLAIVELRPELVTWAIEAAVVTASGTRVSLVIPAPEAARLEAEVVIALRPALVVRVGPLAWAAPLAVAVEAAVDVGVNDNLARTK